MQLASEATILGDFGGATFSYAGVTSRFFRRDGKFFVRTDGPDGALADFEVRYTFGVHPLQQYLVEMPRGPLQALSIAWDARPAGRRAALVPPLPRREDRPPRRAALDATAAELELHVRGLPLDQRREALRRHEGRVRDDLVGNIGRLRGVSRPGLGPSRVGRAGKR